MSMEGIFPSAVQSVASFSPCSRPRAQGCRGDHGRERGASSAPAIPDLSVRARQAPTGSELARPLHTCLTF